MGFGTGGTVFGTTVMAASGMADADQGLVAACFGPRPVGSTGIAASITTIDVPAQSDTSEQSIQMRRTARDTIRLGRTGCGLTAGLRHLAAGRRLGGDG